MKKLILIIYLLLGACQLIQAQSVTIQPNTGGNGNLLNKSTGDFYGNISTTSPGGADLNFRRDEPSGGNGTGGVLVGTLGTWSNRFQIQANGTHYLNFNVNNADRLRIMTNGYVGLNTAAPSRFFHVNGSMILTETADSANVQIGSTFINNAKLVVSNNNFQHGVYIDSPFSPGGYGLFVNGRTRLEGFTEIEDRLEVNGSTRLNDAIMQNVSVNNLSVSGTISKPSGSFKIDHPLDPENKILYHSFVESPDMMNIYNGNINTDAQGFANVILPDYFEALNIDFRYQLTCVGTFAQAIVSQKVKDNFFIIQTDKPNVEVSWQVTGVRNDAYAKKFRIPNTVDKPSHEKGKYLYPAAFDNHK
jgi:hypothetical protein